MAQMPEIIASVREGTGKGAARQARRAGNVPGVVYGGGKDPLAINIKFNELLKLLKAGRFLSTLFNLKVDGEDDVRVICRNVQRDVVKDLPVHLDLMRLNRNSRVNLFIPVEFVGDEECPGLRQGGVLTVIRTEVELMVTASAIPEVLEVDISKLEIGDSVTSVDLNLPKGTRLTITDREFMLANVSAPSALKSEDDEDEEDAEEVTEEGEEAEGDGEENAEE